MYRCHAFSPAAAPFPQAAYVIETPGLKIDSCRFSGRINLIKILISQTFCDEFVILLKDNYAVWGNYAYIVLLRR